MMTSLPIGAGQEPLVIASDAAEGVRLITLNRPSKRNALSHELIQQLLVELSAANSEDAVKVVVLSGGSSFFCAGADIKEIASLGAEEARRGRYLEDLCHGMKSVRKPLIAAVEGMALGGGFELALMCDLIYASENARFGLPEVNIGLIPGAGGTQRLTSAVGKFQAMNMILTGDPISSQESLAAGFVAQIWKDGHVLDNVLTAATKMAKSSTVALALAKEAICRADDKGRDDEFERSLYYFAFGTQDKREGVSAFLEKRKPRWSS